MALQVTLGSNKAGQSSPQLHKGKGISNAQSTVPAVGKKWKAEI